MFGPPSVRRTFGLAILHGNQVLDFLLVTGQFRVRSISEYFGATGASCISALLACWSPNRSRTWILGAQLTQNLVLCLGTMLKPAILIGIRRKYSACISLLCPKLVDFLPCLKSAPMYLLPRPFGDQLS